MRTREGAGGPAFPLPAVPPTVSKNGEIFHHTAYEPPQYGMTLRDYFAAKAMQGLMARIGTHDVYLIAHDAYIMADAMLAERLK